MMNRPTIVRYVVYALVANIILSSVVAAFNLTAGHISGTGAVVNISISVFVAVLAYKIYHGSNGARYLYAIFFVITCFLFFGHVGHAVPDLRYLLKIIQLPINIYILYGLFGPKSTGWFNQ